MRRVLTRRLIAVLALVILLAPPSAFADSGSVDPGLWTEFVTWVEGRIGFPNGAATTADGMSFEDWLVLMARIGIPPG